MSKQATFDIAIQTTLRHGGLAVAVRKLGSVAALARSLGVQYVTVCGWCNLKHVPRFEHWAPEQRDHVAAVLHELTGQSLEELWPTQLREATEFLGAPKRFERHQKVQLAGMLTYAAETRERLTYDPVEQAAKNERVDFIKRLLPKLRDDRERGVITWRFGLDGSGQRTLEQCAKEFGVTRERIRQIEIRALRRLQVWAERVPGKPE